MKYLIAHVFYWYIENVRLAKSLPSFLNRAKTPNIEFDGYVKATKLIPGHLEPQSTSFSGRINSPPHSFQPPPTAPNLGTWMNSRLPPISSGLESLQENTLMSLSNISFLFITLTAKWMTPSSYHKVNEHTKRENICCHFLKRHNMST